MAEVHTIDEKSILGTYKFNDQKGSGRDSYQSIAVELCLNADHTAAYWDYAITGDEDEDLGAKGTWELAGEVITFTGTINYKETPVTRKFKVSEDGLSIRDQAVTDGYKWYLIRKPSPKEPVLVKDIV